MQSVMCTPRVVAQYRRAELAPFIPCLVNLQKKRLPKKIVVEVFPKQGLLVIRGLISCFPWAKGKLPLSPGSRASAFTFSL